MRRENVIYGIDFDIVNAVRKTAELQAKEMELGKTTETVADKMQRLANTAGGIGGKFGKDVKMSNDELKKYNAELAKTEKQMNAATKAGNSFNNMFAGAAKTFAVYASLDFLSSQIEAIVDITAETQKYSVVLGNVYSAYSSNAVAAIRAAETMDLIEKIAASTPFSVQELTSSFVKLANSGFIPVEQEIIALGDLAAATGKNFDQLAEAVIDAQTGEMERLKEFGIKAKKEGENITFTFKGVSTQIKNNAADIQNYLVGLGQMKGVGGGMEKISATIGGQLSNLGDQVDAFRKKLGNELEPAIVSTIGVLAQMVTFLVFLVNAFRSLPQFIEENRKTFIVLGVAVGALNGLLAVAAARTLYQTAAAKLDILWKQRQIMVTNLLQSATVKLIASLMANPYAALAIALTAVGTALAVMYYQAKLASDENYKLAKASREVTEAAAKEQAGAQLLFNELNNVNTTQARRRELMAEINEKYKEYLPYLLNEHSTLKDIAIAQDAVIKGIYNRIVAETLAMKQKAEMEKLINLELELENRLNEIAKTDPKLAKQAKDLLEEQRILVARREAYEKFGIDINKINAKIEIREAQLREQGVTKSAAATDAKIVELNKLKEEQEKLQLANKAGDDANTIALEKNFQARLKLGSQLDTFFGRFKGTLSAVFGGVGSTQIIFNRVSKSIDEGISLQNRYDSLLKQINVDLTDPKVTGAGTGAGKHNKELGLHIKNLEADTKAIEKNTAAMIAQERQINALRKQADAVFNKTQTPLALDMAEMRRQTNEMEAQAEVRREVAELDLQAQLDAQLRSLAEQQKHAAEELVQERAKTGKERNEAKIAELQRISGKDAANKLIITLQKQFREESLKIENTYVADLLAIDRTEYQMRLQLLENFYRARLTAARKNTEEMKKMAFELHQAILIEDIGTPEARRSAASERFEFELQAEKKFQDERLALREQYYEKLKRAEAEVDALTAADAPSGEIAEAAQEAQTNRAALLEIETELELSNQRILVNEREMWLKIIALEKEQLELRISEWEKARKRMNDVMAGAGAALGRAGELAPQAQPALAIGNKVRELATTKFKDTREGSEIKFEQDIAQKNIDNYKRIKEEKGSLNEQEAKEYAEFLKKKGELDEAYAKAKKEFDMANFQTAMDLISQTAEMIGNVINQAIQAQIEIQDKLIENQKKNVDKARENLLNAQNKGLKDRSKVNAEYLQLEEKRLADLEKQRQKLKEDEKKLAIALLVINTSVAIAKAAAQGGVAAGITIGVTLAALALGLVAARAASESAAAGFAKGGYTGDGSASAAAGVVHKGEFVFDKEKTAKHRAFFEALHHDKIDLKDYLASTKIPTLAGAIGFGKLNMKPTVFQPLNAPAVDVKGLIDTMKDVKDAIENQERMSLSIDERGVQGMVNRLNTKQSRVRNLAKK